MRGEQSKTRRRTVETRVAERVRRTRAIGYRASALAAGVAVVCLVAGVAEAGLVTLIAPYNAATILGSPTTWSTGTGFIKWPTAPNAHATNGLAGYDVWTRTTASAAGGTWGSDTTQAGFNVSELCGPCVGDTSVTFNWKVTWNYTLDLTCAGGTATNLFDVNGQILDATGLSHGFNAVQVNGQTTTTAPTHQSGGNVNMVVVVTVPLTSGVLNGQYYLHTWLSTEVYTTCPGGTPVGTYSNSELDVASSGGQGATLTSIQIS